MTSPLVQDAVWLQQPRFEEAEADFQQYLIHGRVPDHEDKGSSTLVKDILQIRQHIQTAMNTVPNDDFGTAMEQRLDRLEQENKELKQTVEDLRKMISSLSTQLKAKYLKEDTMEVDPQPVENNKPAEQEEDDDDDVNLFDDDEEDEEAEKIRQERLKAYADKKAKKPALIAKSSVTLDIKPWDDETDMKVLEECVRTIVMDGLLWGASKLVPLAYGIKKLTIVCVIEDDKVSLEDLEEKIVAFEDHIQSMDIAAFQKI